MRHQAIGHVGWRAAVLIGAIACGGQDETCVGPDGQSMVCGGESAMGSAEPLAERLAGIEGDVSLGASGSSVGAIHEYLATYGYLPNESLHETYRWWRPIVAEAPEDPEIFDEHTLKAVQALQLRNGVPVTGVVDAATRAVMRLERCPVPDTARLDPSEKFAHRGVNVKWGGPIKWRVMDTNGMSDSNFRPLPPASCTTTACKAQWRLDQVTTAVGEAAIRWFLATGVQFTYAPTGAFDLGVSFTALSAPAQSFFPDALADGKLQFSNTRNWDATVGGTAIPGYLDITTTALHELGHIIGLQHSTALGTQVPQISGWTDNNFPTMWSAGAQVGAKDISLHVDDTIAGSLLYDSFTRVGTLTARDIAVGPDSSDGDGDEDAWIVSTAAVGGNSANGYEIRKQLGAGGFSAHATGGQGATRIAVNANGHPWIINAQGAIYERSTPEPTSGTWQLRGAGACARDIGSALQTWIVGCADDGSGNYPLYRWDGNAWVQPASRGSGVRITVDGNGAVWLLQADGKIWRLKFESAAWERMPGTARDIAAYPSVNTVPVPTGGSRSLISYVYMANPALFAWNEQAADPNDPSGYSPAESQWFPLNDVAEQVAVSPSGVPWIVKADGSIWKQR